MTEHTIRLRWEEKGLDRVNASFSLNAIHVRATFELGDHAWHASFKVKSDCSQDTVSLALQVFGGVFQAVYEFLAVREPGMLVFVTDRADLAAHYRSHLDAERARIEGLGYLIDLPALTLRQA